MTSGQVSPLDILMIEKKQWRIKSKQWMLGLHPEVGKLYLANYINCYYLLEVMVVKDCEIAPK